MSTRETPLTRAFWESLGDGVLYEEFRIAKTITGQQSWRAVDGLVVLGQPPRLGGTGSGVSLNGKDIVVIQTKAERLGPYVFGQALLSPELIRQQWEPRSIRSVLLCTADDPEFRTVTNAFPEVEVHIVKPFDNSYRLPLARIPAAVNRYAQRRGLPLVAPSQLTGQLRIDGVLLPPGTVVDDHPLKSLVAGRRVTSAHSTDGPLCMYTAGEVVASQRFLLDMGAKAVKSVVVTPRGDSAVAPALRQFGKLDVVLSDAL